MALTPQQLASGRWRGGYKLNGRTIRATFDYAHEAQDWAEREEAAARASQRIATPAAPTPGGTTISAHGIAWLARKGHLAKGTRDGYGTHLRAIAATGLGALDIATVRRSQVETWITAQLDAGAGRPSINARLKVLRMVYIDAMAEGLALADPTHGIRELPTTLRQDRVLTAAELARVLAVATPTQRAMVLLATDAGLRWQEVAGLSVSAVLADELWVGQVVERSTGQVRGYPKGHRARTVPIATDRLSAALRPILMAAGANPDALLFTRATGAPLDYWDWRRDQWRPLCRAAALTPRPRFHDLRHTYGSLLAGSSVPRSEIAKLLGHADEATTARYIHTGDNQRRAQMVRQALSA